MKKTLSILLSILMAFSAFSVMPFNALADDSPADTIPMIKVTLNDSYGDGWEGAYLQLQTPQGIIQLTGVPPYPNVSYIPVPVGDEINPGGDKYECTVVVSFIQNGATHVDEISYTVEMPDGYKIERTNPRDGDEEDYTIKSDTPGGRDKYERLSIKIHNSLGSPLTSGYLTLEGAGYTFRMSGIGYYTDADLLILKGQTYHIHWTPEISLGVNDNCEISITLPSGKIVSISDLSQDPNYVYPETVAIDSAEKLMDFAEAVNSDGQTNLCAELTDDIVLDSDDWVPIGNASAPYTGTFDGKGHTITGLSNSGVSSKPEYVGMFGCTKNATIKNLGMVNETLSSDNYVGGIVAQSVNSKVESCYSTRGSLSLSAMKSGPLSCGGIVGKSVNSTVENCYSANSLSLTVHEWYLACCGGIVGISDETSVIKNCYHSGSFSSSGGSCGLGGIAGQNKGKVENCYNTSELRGAGKAPFVGGIAADNKDTGQIVNCYNKGLISASGIEPAAGGIASSNDGTIRSCYNTASVIGIASGYCYCGGIAHQNAGDGKIINCYNTGDISCSGSIKRAGGIVALNSATLENCYNTGKISSSGDDSRLGGLIGFSVKGTKCQNCYSAGLVKNDGPNDYCGGLVGYIFNESEYAYCYYDNSFCPDVGAVGSGSRFEYYHSDKVVGLTTAQMTGTNALNKMEFAYGTGETSPWLTKADGADGKGNYYFYYPHLTGFDFADDSGQRVESYENGTQMKAEDILSSYWPPKVKVSMSWNEKNSYSYDGTVQAPELTSLALGDDVLEEGCTAYYEKYENGSWGAATSSVPTETGSYRMTLMDKDGYSFEKMFYRIALDDINVSYKKRGETTWEAVTETKNAGDYKVLLAIKNGEGNVEPGHPAIERAFTINKASLTVTARDQEYTYNGSIQGEGDTVYTAETGLNNKVEVQGLQGDDTLYSALLDGQASEAGTHADEITVKSAIVKNGTDTRTDNYEISYVPGDLKINPKSISGFTVKLSADSVTYNGNDNRPSVESVNDDTTTLAANTDYTVSYTEGDWKDAGTYKVTVTGKGNYKDSVEKTFTIDKKAVTITAGSDSKTYDGTPLTKNSFSASALETGDTHTFTVQMTQGSTITDFGKKANVIASVDGVPVTTGVVTPVGNYNVTALNGELSINKADATVTITGKNDSSVFDEKEHSVTGYDFATTNSLYTTNDFTFSGNAFAKRTDEGKTFMGLLDTMFTNTSNNFNVTFNIIDGYQKILARKLDPAKVDITIDDVTYDGTAKEPVVKVGDTVLEEGKDYTVTITNADGDPVPSINGVGEYTVSIEGTGNYTGATTKTVTVEPAKVTITAEDKKSTLGDALKELTYKVDGKVAAGDDLGIKLTTDADKNKTGTYKITATYANANYKATIVDGVYTVNEVPDYTSEEKEEAENEINSAAAGTTTSKAVTIYWGKTKKAKYFEIYATYCGRNDFKKIATVGGNVTKYDITKLFGKKLDQTKNVKVYVIAYGDKGKLSRSLNLHVAGFKTKFSNVKKIKLKKNKLTIKAGKSKKIKGKIVLENKKKKPVNHVKKLRFRSSNKKIATVTKSGKVKAKKKGTCWIYVYANNGMAKKVKITVK